MRYDNWDVLVMPLDSQVPIPEFKVEAYPVNDKEAPPINSIFNFTRQTPLTPIPTALFDTPPSSSGVSSPQITHTGQAAQTTQAAQAPPAPLMYAQMPLLSCFVPSLPAGMAFKVSVHRWEQIPFVIDSAVVSMTGRIPCCEVRVFVDGNLVSDGVIKPDTSWPFQIGTGYSVNPKLCRGYLRWPKFDEHQLSQDSWDPGEDHGRIKVIISEGIMHQTTGRVTRTKNLVSFAFQHAPLEILQGANIAWPSERLWLNSDFSVQNNTLTNANQPVIAPNKDTDHEANQDRALFSDHQCTPNIKARDLNPKNPTHATTSLLTQAIVKSPEQKSPEGTYLLQRNSFCGMSMPFNSSPFYQPLSASFPRTPESATATQQNHTSYQATYYPELKHQIPNESQGSPVRKKRATEDKLTPSKPAGQADTKPKPTIKSEAEKAQTKKAPVRRPRAAKSAKPVIEPSGAKPPAQARKAPAKKNISTAPVPASVPSPALSTTPSAISDGSGSTEGNEQESMDGKSTTVEKEEN